MEGGERSSGDFQNPSLPPLSSHVSGQSAALSGHPAPPSSSSSQAPPSPLHIPSDLPSIQPHSTLFSPLQQPSTSSRTDQLPPASTPPPGRVCSGQAPPSSSSSPALIPLSSPLPTSSSPIPWSFNPYGISYFSRSGQHSSSSPSSSSYGRRKSSPRVPARAPVSPSPPPPVVLSLPPPNPLPHSSGMSLPEPLLLGSASPELQTLIPSCSGLLPLPPATLDQSSHLQTTGSSPPSYCPVVLPLLTGQDSTIMTVQPITVSHSLSSPPFSNSNFNSLPTDQTTSKALLSSLSTSHCSLSPPCPDLSHPTATHPLLPSLLAPPAAAHQDKASLLGPPPSLPQFGSFPSPIPPTFSTGHDIPPRAASAAPTIPSTIPFSSCIRSQDTPARASSSPVQDPPRLPFIPLPKRAVGTHEGMPSVCFTDAELKLTATEFQYSVVLKFAQGNPALAAIRKAIAGWGFSSSYSVGILDRRHVFVHLTHPADLSTALAIEAKRIEQRSFRCSRWTPDFCPQRESSHAAVWVTLPRLPVRFYYPSFLQCLGDVIGTFLKLDEPTISMTKPKQARMCVEVDCSLPLPKRIWIARENGEGHWQHVEYERLPLFCSHCHSLGHSSSECRRFRAPQSPRDTSHSTSVAVSCSIPSPLVVDPLQPTPTSDATVGDIPPSSLQQCTSVQSTVQSTAALCAATGQSSPPSSSCLCSPYLSSTTAAPPSPSSFRADHPPPADVPIPAATPIAAGTIAAAPLPPPPINDPSSPFLAALLAYTATTTALISSCSDPPVHPIFSTSLGRKPKQKTGLHPRRRDGKCRKRELFAALRASGSSSSSYFQLQTKTPKDTSRLVHGSPHN